MLQRCDLRLHLQLASARVFVDLTDSGRLLLPNRRTVNRKLGSCWEC